MLPNKPYLVRAFYEWICDSECTPYVVVDTTVDYVEVPEEFIENNQIVLNLTPSAIRDLVMDNRYLSFTAQFSGVIKNIYAPIASIVAVYAKENGLYTGRANSFYNHSISIINYLIYVIYFIFILCQRYK